MIARASLLAATLLLAACGSLPRTDLGVDDDAGMDAGVVEPDLGARDVGPPDRGPDVGPLDRGPIPDLGTDPDRPLAPLEIQRVTAGSRLAPFLWVLPDGSTVPQRDELYDSAFNLACFGTDAVEDGAFRCMPLGRDRVGVFAADDCDRPSARQSTPDELCEEAFITQTRTVGDDMEYRLFEQLGPDLDFAYFVADGVCAPAEPSGRRYYDSVRVPDARLAGATVTSRDVEAGLREVTTTYEDGTVIVERVMDEPCGLASFDRTSAEFRCVPNPLGVSALSATYADAECSEPVLAESLWRFGGRPSYAVLTPDDVRDSVIYEVPTGDVEAAAVFGRNGDGACVPRGEAPVAFVRLTRAVPPTDFPRLTRTPVGTGRLRPYRYVDAAGFAWPFRSSFLFDADLEVDCWPTGASGGVRCVPFPTVNESARFVDDECAERALQSRLPIRYWYTYTISGGPPRGCDLYRRIEPLILPDAVSDLIEAEPVQRTYVRHDDGSCALAPEDPRYFYARAGNPTTEDIFAPIGTSPF